MKQPTLEKLPAFSKNGVHVIIETPKGSQNKFNYDPEYNVFKLAKTLPMGTVFPFDFGFIPNTKGQDGDPLDVLVIMDEPAYPGCLVECRLLGVLTARQQEKNGEEVRNDRFVAVALSSILYKDITDIKALNKAMVEEIENFFKDYNKHRGKKFTPQEWYGEAKAFKMVKKRLKRNNVE